MKMHKYEKLIKGAFRTANAKIRPHLISYNEDGTLLFHIIILPGTRIENLYAQARNIQICLEIPVFNLFLRDNRLYLLVMMKKVKLNSFFDLVHSSYFQSVNMKYPIAVGYDEFGCPAIYDLGRMTHILYAGSTNSGKSKGLICLILSLIIKQSVSDINFIIFDIGASSLQEFEGIPHLSHPIVKDKFTGIYVIEALTREMERRISVSEAELNSLPTIVCVIDEFTSLVANLVDKNLSDRFRNAINNLLRRGRKAKIHMILATQNATQEAMQSDIGNITDRFVFRVSSAQSSKALIGETGAESLPGKGAMIFKSSEMEGVIRLQGAYVSDEEVRSWTSKLKASNLDTSGRFCIPVKNCAEEYYQNAIGNPQPECDCQKNSELCKAILWTLSRTTISANSLKNEMKIGNRANEIIDKLSSLGIISGKNANKPREVLLNSPEELPQEVYDILNSCDVPETTIQAAFDKRIQ